MDDTEDDARYPPNNQQESGSSNRQKLPARNAPYPEEVENQYADDDDNDNEGDDNDEEETGDEDGDNNQKNGIRYTVKDNDDDDDDDETDDDVDDDEENRKDLSMINDEDPERHPKKRKMKSLVSSYEFAPRVPAAPATKPSSAGRNPLTDWTELETFTLLDAWGEKFLMRGRKSLRSEEWHEVAERVSKVSKIERTDTQCRNRLDTLKKKYKKEKSGLPDGRNSKWIYFSKMDLLLSMSNPRVYPNRANGLDKARDTTGDSESSGDDDDDLEELPVPPKKRRSGRDSSEVSSIRVLVDSIHRFSEIYEKIESSKRKQMLELEKMRMDFERDLEMQKMQIMERARAEIAKIRREEEENEISAENASG